MKSVLLALSSEEFSREVAKTITNSKLYCLAAVAESGAEAIAKLIMHCPQILVIDLSLPREGGLSVLQAAKRMKTPPACVVLTREMNPMLTEALLHLGIEDVLLQPCRVTALFKYMYTLIDGEDRHEKLISGALQDLQIGAQYAGHRYLLSGIALAMEDMSRLDAVTKLLYPDIAAQHGVSAEQVERNIRSAIERAWSYGAAEAMREQFQYETEKRPTNAEFLSVVADRLLRRCKSEARDADPNTK